MPLISQLFKGDPVFEACLTKDSAHIVQGAKGPHIAKIHFALMTTDKFYPAQSEIDDSIYGPSTATGVLAYKRKRRIINFGYEKQADNIVGKMTIARMDADMFRLEIVLRGQQIIPIPPRPVKA
jgi:hypothetical protein